MMKKLVLPKSYIIFLKYSGAFLFSPILIILFLIPMHDFLSLNNPIEGDALVVEGWLPDHFIELAVDRFKTGSYRKLIVIGGPIEKGDVENVYETYAQLAAKRISDLGLESKSLVVLPYFNKSRHKTYSSFLPLRDWLNQSDHDKF